MNSRERVMTALNHKEPDRVPVDMVVTIEVYRDLKRTLGIEAPDNPKMGRWTDVQMPLEMIKALGLDAYWVSPRSAISGHSKTFDDGSFIDEWGCHWKKTVGDNYFYFALVDPPLAHATIEDLNNYEWPDPDDPVRYSALEKEMKYVRENSDLAILAKFAGAVFELATYMRGHEQWYEDLLLNKEFAHALMDKICRIQMKINENCMRAVGKYVDVLRMSGEDLGMQDRPLISPKLFREVIKPHLKMLWTHAKETLHKYNPEAKTMQHSCGDIYHFIPDFIECGIDILDPVQPRAAEMDRFRLKKEFGDNICFHGAVDIQKVLPFGTKEEIIEEVKTSIKALAPGGGYWLAPAHNVQSDVSAKNLLIMIDAVKKYGNYPINVD